MLIRIKFFISNIGENNVMLIVGEHINNLSAIFRKACFVPTLNMSLSKNSGTSGVSSCIKTFVESNICITSRT